MGDDYSLATYEEEETLNSLLWSEGLSTKLAEIIKTGILLVDIGERIRFANDPAASMLGRSRKDLVGKSIRILFLPDDLNIFLPNIMNMTLKGPGFEGEALIRRGDEESFFVNLSTSLYRDSSTGDQFMIVAFQDITRLKEMEKKYEGSERFAGLGMMTDQISHQIRNPIVSIGGFALRLARDRAVPGDYAQYSTIIHNEARRLEYIIDRLVEFAGVHSIRHSSLTVPDVFQGAMDSFGPEPEKHRARVVFPEPDTLPDSSFYGDRDLLVRALRGIIQNGLEATGDRGEVRVSGEGVRNQVSIRVRDDGEGIDAKNLPLVFDPFFTTKFNSLGLGLTMAKRIIDAHKGRISIVSEAGKGTEVRIFLPRDRRREIRTKLLPG